MSAPRFKSKSDYFTKRSNLTERVIGRKPPAKRKRTSSAVVPVSLMEDIFCGIVETFEIEGEGRFNRKDRPLEDAIASHLDGEATVLVNPLDRHGMTAWHMLPFSLSDETAHPFSKAREFADALDRHGIPSLLEVTEGGKGHYHLWILHERPVEAAPVTRLLRDFGVSVAGFAPAVIPAEDPEHFVALPLQYESVLLQRRVFVNTVGKKVKDQRALLEKAGRAARRSFDSLVNETVSQPASAETAQPSAQKPEPAKPVDTAAAPPPEPAPAAAKPEPAPPLRKSAESKTGKTARDTVGPAPATVPPVQESAATSQVRPSAEHVHEQKGSLMNIVRFRYGDHQYGIPAGVVNRVIAWHGGEGESSPGKSLMIEGRELPVVFSAISVTAPGNETPAISALLLVEHDGSRLLVPASGVDGIIRITLGTASEADQSRLLGTAVFGDSAIQVLDPGKLLDGTTEKSAAPVKTSGRKADTGDRRYLLFSLGEKQYAMETAAVAEILSGSAIRRIPVAHGDERIVAESDGTYIPVIEFPGLPEDGAGKLVYQSLRIVVVKDGKESRGLRVDAIDGFETVRAADLRLLPGDADSWCTGAIERPGGDPVLIVDARRIKQE